MADVLKATVHAGGVAYLAGTKKDEIPADHLKTITNPDAFGPAEDDQDELVVQTAPVFGLPVEDEARPAKKAAPRKPTSAE